MKTILISYGIGVLLTILSMFMISHDYRVAANHHLHNNADRVTAMVTDKEDYNKTIRTSRGKFERTIYRISVTFKDPQYGFKRQSRIEEFISQKEFDALMVGDSVEVSDLGNMPQPNDFPRILLASSIDNSIFHKFFYALKGDLSHAALGIIVLVFGILGIFIGTVVTFGRKR